MEKYQNTVTDRSGNVLSGVTVRVYDAGTTDLSTIYSDDGITQINQGASPISTDANGYFSFYAPYGDYDIIATNGTATASWLDVSLGSSDEEITFTQAGTGAVARTLDSKLSETVSVKDFGATGDGVTDDTAAIQAAIDYAETLNGCTVYFPRGTYLVSDTLTIDSNGVFLQGEHFEASVIKRATDYGSTILFTGNGTTRIEDFGLAHLYLQAAGTATFGAHIDIHGATRGHINNVMLRNGFHGIHIRASSQILISDYWHFNNTNYSGSATGRVLFYVQDTNEQGYIDAELNNNGDIFVSNFNIRGLSSSGLFDYNLVIEQVDGIWFNNGHWQGAAIAQTLIKPELNGLRKLNLVFFNNVMWDECDGDGHRFDGDMFRVSVVQFTGCNFRGGRDGRVGVRFMPDCRVYGVMFTGCILNQWGNEAVRIEAPNAEETQFVGCQIKENSFDSTPVVTVTNPPGLEFGNGLDYFYGVVPVAGGGASDATVYLYIKSSLLLTPVIGDVTVEPYAAADPAAFTIVSGALTSGGVVGDYDLYTFDILIPTENKYSAVYVDDNCGNVSFVGTKIGGRNVGAKDAFTQYGISLGANTRNISVHSCDLSSNQMGEMYGTSNDSGRYSGNELDSYAAVVASGTTLTIPDLYDYALTSGNATISSITPRAPGRILTLRFSGNSKVRDAYTNTSTSYTSGTPAGNDLVFTYLGSDNLLDGDPVVLTTTGTLPGPLALSTTYYVRDLNTTANTFKLAATAGGAAIQSDGVTAGSGTITFTSNWPYPLRLNGDFQAGTGGKSTLTLIQALPTEWMEVSRSINGNP